MMKRYILLLLCSLYSAIVWAQKPVLSAPVARQSNNDIILEYSIQMEQGVTCEVALYLSCDGGQHFQKNALKKVTGDVGKIETSGKKTIVWHVLDEEEALTGDDLVFKVNVEKYSKRTAPASEAVVVPKPQKKVKQAPQNKESAIFIAPTVGIVPGLSYGGMAGYVGKIGFYGKFRSNFENTKISYNCKSDGTADGGYIWTTGQSKVSMMSISGGIILPIGQTIYPYAGVGYGKRILAWEDVKKQWARVSDASTFGIALETGLMLRFGAFGLHAGVNTVGFRFIGADAGLALFF